MFGLRKREPLDLSAPRKPDEAVFDNLQLTRLGKWFEHRFRGLVIGFTATVLIFLVGFAVFIVRSDQQDDEGNRRDDRLEEAVREILAVRSEARMALCEKDERFAEAHNQGFRAIEEQLTNFLTALRDFANSTDTPEEVARNNTFVEDQIRTITESLAESQVEVPVCTPDEIEDFYSGDATTTTTAEAHS